MNPLLWQTRSEYQNLLTAGRCVNFRVWKKLIQFQISAIYLVMVIRRHLELWRDKNGKQYWFHSLFELNYWGHTRSCCICSSMILLVTVSPIFLLFSTSLFCCKVSNTGSWRLNTWSSEYCVFEADLVRMQGIECRPLLSHRCTNGLEHF